MATEISSSLPVDRKGDSGPSKASEDTMAVDASAPEGVNGHVTSDEAQVASEDAPTINGTTEPKSSEAATADEDKVNAEAFAANSSLPEQIPEKSSEEAKKAEDTEMSDAPKPEPASETQPTESETKAIVTSAGEQEPPATTKEPAKPTTDEAMDIDTSTDRPDLTSSAEHGVSTQDTSAISDAPVVASPEESSQQPADLSKLEIKASQDDVNVSQTDLDMADRAVSPTKVARERDEDGAEEPAAKRTKTDLVSGEAVQDSLVVATGAQPSSKPVEDTVPNDLVITAYQNKQLRQVLASIKKTKNGGNFKSSVEKLWPSLWEDYSKKIVNPVDLSLFEHKLREEQYPDYGSFKTDVKLLYENTVAYNGPAHQVTSAAAMVRDQILSRLSDVSKAEEPAKPEKGKIQPTRHAEPRAATQPRRESSSQKRRASDTSPKPKAETPAAAPVATPATPSSANPAFALPPNGVPQIRRDSTRDDGDRPKRPIQPPKNRDPDYSAKANRKKKLEPEQRFFEEVLAEVKKVKYYHLNQWFLEPVDPVALQLPTYFNIVKKPMDLTLITERLYQGEYKTPKDMEKDMAQIVKNSELFNGVDHDVTKQARELEKIFKDKMAEKNDWMAKHYPVTEPAAAAPGASPEHSVLGSEDESEEEAEEGDNEAIRSLQERVTEEQDKLNTLLSSKKPDVVMIEMQQNIVTMVMRKLIEEKTKFANEDKKKAPKKKTTKSKPRTSVGGANAGGSKKASGAAAGASKKASGGTKKAAPKKRVMGAMEKTVIANGIGELNDATLNKAVEIIKKDTGQNENDSGEMELDIEMLSQEALSKLYDLINKAHPSIRAAVEQQPEYREQVAAEARERAAVAASKPKKNKPMNKHEQERKIEQLRELKAQLERQGSGSQEPVPLPEGHGGGADSSEEEESDSEEE